MYNGTARRVAIIGGVRTPFCRAHGGFANLSNQDMMTAALGGLVQRFALKGEKLDDATMGAVIRHSRDWNLARECVLGSGLAPETPAFDLTRACGTSLEAVILMGHKIALGQIEVGIGGGTDSISDAPVVYPRQLPHACSCKATAGAASWQKLRPWLGLRPSHFKPEFPGVVEPRTGLSMGESCELMAQEWNISREEQDALALLSHQHAASAWEAGFYDDLVVPLAGVTRDNNVRGRHFAGEDGQAQAGFRAQRQGHHDRSKQHATHRRRRGRAGRVGRLGTEARSAGSGLSDLRAGRGRGFCWRRGSAYGADLCGVENAAAGKALSLQDFDFYEIHEAFAAQVLCTLRAWESEEFCRERLGRDAAAWQHRSQQNEHHGRQPGGRPSVCCDRRKDCCNHGQAARPARVQGVV